ncbi:MAG TPA: diacylglycerol kinase family protein [Burkholderiales bacterium]|nr:diacylglycerol kinase family protein [Burkholderiales bacterium]
MLQPYEQDSPQQDPLFIILNVGSGSGDAREASEIIRGVLDAAGREHELLVVDDPHYLQSVTRRATELAVRRQGILVAAGGDGTINTVAHAALNSGRPFGVIPQGTFNYFSRTHGIPSDTAEAAKALLSATIRPVQVGLVNDHLFLVNASLGLYPKLLEDREAYKQQFGRKRWIALWSGLMTMLRENRHLVINLHQGNEMQTLRTSTLFVGNNLLQLKQIGLPEADAVEQGKLAAILVKPVGMFAMLGLLLRGALGQLGESTNVRSFAFDRLTVQPWLPFGRRGIKVAMDGEVTRIRTPLTFEVAAKRLLLLVPAASAA